MRTIVIFLVLLTLTGCTSRLRVEVKIANRDKVIEKNKDYGKEQLLISLISLENYVSQWDEEKILNQIYAFLEKVNNEDGEKNKLHHIKEIYKESFSNKYSPLIAQLRENLKEAKILYNEAKYDEVRGYLEQVYLLISDIQLQLSFYKVDTKEINLSNALPDISEVQNPRERFPILGDPIASFIARNSNSKEDDLWDSRFNETIASSFLGNSDVAYILRSNPPEQELKSGDYNNNFTIKGVKMDASDVTNTIFTSLAQTINFIATTQGIPTRATATTDNPQPQQDQDILGLAESQKDYELKKKRYKDYKYLLLEKIKMENIERKKGDELTESIDRIKKYWDYIKVELNK